MPNADYALSDRAAAGYCIDEWQRWHQGQCGTYATALIRLNPSLRLGLSGYADGEFFDWQHAFAHDDTWAYDSAGRHLLPYLGIDGQFDMEERDQIDWGLAEDESGPEGPEANIADAIAHATRNGILEGRYGAHIDSYPTCSEGDHPNDDNPGKPMCKTCEDWT